MKWERLAEGFEVLRTWKTPRRKAVEPEIAVLRLSRKKLEELQKSLKEFINHPQVFSKPVTSLLLFTPKKKVTKKATRVAKSKAGNIPILAVIVHYPSCCGRGAVIPEETAASLR